MIIDGKQVKTTRVYLEDFKGRKYKTLTFKRKEFHELIEKNFDKWLATYNAVNKTNYKGYVLTGKNHLCRFCGGFVLGTDKDEMCEYCAERFKTKSFKEYKKTRKFTRVW